MIGRRVRLAGLMLGAVLAGLAALAAACGGGEEAGGTAAQPPAQRTIYMATIEPKGSTTVDKEPFPTQKLPPGPGWALKEPVDGKWEVEIYRYDPGTIVVNEGDEVTLEILGINGKEHPTVIDGYGLEFNVKRGQLTTVNFTADKAGTFQIACQIHQPSMKANLVVLPRP